MVATQMRKQAMRPKSKPKQPRKGPKAQRSGAVTTSRSEPVARAATTHVRSQPQQTRLPNGDVVIRHRELIGSVPGGSISAYGVVSNYAINAGNAALNSWLSSVSQQYESYKYLSLAVDYVPFAPTTVSGVVYLTADYDPTDPSPPDAQAASTSPGSVSGHPGRPHRLTCRPSDLNKRQTYFVRTPGVGDGLTALPADPRTVDTGNIFIATDSVANASGTAIARIGQLWVSYEVRLYTPQKASAPPVALYARRTLDQTVGAGQKYFGITGAASTALQYLDDNVTLPWPAPEAGVTPAQDYGAKVAVAGKYLAIMRTLLKSKDGTNPDISALFHNIQSYLPTGASNKVFAPFATSVNLGPASGSTADVTSTFAIDLDQGDSFYPAVAWRQGSSKALGLDQRVSLTPVTNTIYNHLATAFTSSKTVGYRTYDRDVIKNGGTSNAADPLGNSYIDAFPENLTKVGGDITFPGGHFKVVLVVTGTTLVASALDTDVGSYYSEVSVNAAGTKAIFVVKFLSNDVQVLTTSLTSAASVTAAQMYVSAMEYGASNVVAPTGDSL